MKQGALIVADVFKVKYSHENLTEIIEKIPCKPKTVKEKIVDISEHLEKKLVVELQTAKQHSLSFDESQLPDNKSLLSGYTR